MIKRFYNLIYSFGNLLFYIVKELYWEEWLLVLKLLQYYHLWYYLVLFSLTFRRNIYTFIIYTFNIYTFYMYHLNLSLRLLKVYPCTSLFLLIWYYNSIIMCFAGSAIHTQFFLLFMALFDSRKPILVVHYGLYLILIILNIMVLKWTVNVCSIQNAHRSWQIQVTVWRRQWIVIFRVMLLCW